MSYAAHSTRLHLRFAACLILLASSLPTSTGAQTITLTPAAAEPGEHVTIGLDGFDDLSELSVTIVKAPSGRIQLLEMFQGDVDEQPFVVTVPTRGWRSTCCRRARN